MICGSGHVAYGLGTPARVATRLPGVRDRVIIFSESGDVELTAQERAVSRPIEITHDQWRAINRPVADYLYVTSIKTPSTSSPPPAATLIARTFPQPLAAALHDDEAATPLFRIPHSAS